MHTIIEVQPVPVAIIAKGNIVLSLQRSGLKNVKANVWVNKKKAAEEFGELQFGITTLASRWYLHLDPS